MRDALDRLGYRVIEAARYFQFVRTLRLGGREREVNLDILTRRPDPAAYPQLPVDDRRVRPRASVQLHAHTSDDARVATA